jgi:hypothetical protein
MKQARRSTTEEATRGAYIPSPWCACTAQSTPSARPCLLSCVWVPWWMMVACVVVRRCGGWALGDGECRRERREGGSKHEILGDGRRVPYVTGRRLSRATPDCGRSRPAFWAAPSKTSPTIFGALLLCALHFAYCIALLNLGILVNFLADLVHHHLSCIPSMLNSSSICFD